MYLIKTCPGCQARLRFPIDKGIIRVKCSCGYSFIADPDDTGLYKHASFDLSPSSRNQKKRSPLASAKNSISLSQVMPFIITRALSIKYKLLNFKLLPDAEKKKIIVALVLVCAAITIIIIAIYLLSGATSASGEKIII